MTNLVKRNTTKMPGWSRLLWIVLGAGFLPAAAPAGPLMGLQAVEDNLPWYQTQAPYFYVPLDRIVPSYVTSIGRPPMPEGLTLRLSRYRFPAEDRHLDAIIHLDAPADEPVPGRLKLTLTAEDGSLLSTETVEEIPGARVFLSYAWPEGMAGRSGTFAVEWIDRDGSVRGRGREDLTVASPREIARSGRIRLQLPNEQGVRERKLPVTAGVPFPRGVLENADHVRLVDEQGREIPLQVKVTAHWSRFGHIRWILCDFAADFDGAERTFYLEYGPEVRRGNWPAMIVVDGDGEALVDNGRLQVGRGLAFRAETSPGWRSLLADGAFPGAFVEHVNDRMFSGYAYYRQRLPRGFDGLPEQYVAGTDRAVTVEESGPVKVVLREEGWYRKPSTGEKFCQYVIRTVIHRDSPLVRVFHTWIFTGDSNRDRISNMGWRFPLAEGMKPAGILTSFGEGGRWADGQYLLQYDYDKNAVVSEQRGADGNEVVVAEGDRGPGVMAASGQGARLYLGVKRFWENYPSELEFEEDGRSMVFHLWPRHGRAPTHPVRQDDLYRFWFAHEGEFMDLSLPREMLQGDIYRHSHRGEFHWHYGRPESVNAQGIAKTTEMWLYATEEQASSTDAVAVLRALNDETLRAVVDPVWVAASGAFGDIHPYDPEQYPDEERVYKLHAQNAIEQVERMGAYGKWIFGDIVRSAELDEQKAPELYRLYRKGHWGWPYSWIPYARSGEPSFRVFAEAATRYMSDVVYCHYVSDDVREQMEALPPQHTYNRPNSVTQSYREKGWHNRNPIPWAGFGGPSTRSYENKVDYLLHAWYLTGYRRAMDVALDWAEQTKIEREEISIARRGLITWPGAGDRPAMTLQRHYLEMYKATFDPWFLAATHAIGDMNVHVHREHGWMGHVWENGPTEFQRFSGRPDHKVFYLDHSRRFADRHQWGWASTPATLIANTAHAWSLTRDDLYLRRALGLLDMYRWSVYDDGPPYYRGYTVRRHTQDDLLDKGWLLRWYPLLLHVKDTARRERGELPPPMPLAFTQRVGDDGGFAVRKTGRDPVALRLEGPFRIEDAAGRVVLEHAERGQIETEIPAESPPGTYTVRMSSRSVTIPLTPPGTPEVMIFPEGKVGEAGYHYIQYWFMVPEGLDEFEIRFDNREPRQPLRQIGIWNPDGEPVWTFRQLTRDYRPGEEIVARVKVPAGQSGRLWRITNPGARDGVPGFQLDRRLPPILAHDPDRWFEP